MVRRRWTGSMVWDGRELGASENWVFNLDQDDLQQIADAVAISEKSGKTLGDLGRSDFPFSAFGRRLIELRHSILNGLGFALIRGLSTYPWTNDEQLVRAYWGMGRWLGDPVPQNAKAHLLGHVIDQRKPQSDETRTYQTNLAQPFHSDSCDTVGLLCLRKARRGGRSAIASSAAIHNALLENSPELRERGELSRRRGPRSLRCRNPHGRRR